MIEHQHPVVKVWNDRRPERRAAAIPPRVDLAARYDQAIRPVFYFVALVLALLGLVLLPGEAVPLSLLGTLAVMWSLGYSLNNLSLMAMTIAAGFVVDDAIIVLENVYGAITSHEGRDMAAICGALSGEGYRFAPLVIDAAQFVPQSRPRLFIVGFADGIHPPADLVCAAPVAPWHPEAFGMSFDLLDEAARKRWLWLRLPDAPARVSRLVDIIEDEPTSVEWHTAMETRQLLSMMTPINLEKVKAAKKAKLKMVGAIYKRTRLDDQGVKRQRAEVRFDDVAGCLRTPAGGSSRQIILVVEGQKVKSRLLSSREAARLMGIPDSYILPARYNDAYHLWCYAW